MSMNDCDVIVVGAGGAGLAAASVAADNGARVCGRRGGKGWRFIDESTKYCVRTKVLMRQTAGGCFALLDEENRPIPGLCR